MKKILPQIAIDFFDGMEPIPPAASLPDNQEPNVQENDEERVQPEDGAPEKPRQANPIAGADETTVIGAADAPPFRQEGVSDAMRIAYEAAGVGVRIKSLKREPPPAQSTLQSTKIAEVAIAQPVTDAPAALPENTEVIEVKEIRESSEVENNIREASPTRLPKAKSSRKSNKNKEQTETSAPSSIDPNYAEPLASRGVMKQTEIPDWATSEIARGRSNPDEAIPSVLEPSAEALEQPAVALEQPAAALEQPMEALEQPAEMLATEEQPIQNQSLKEQNIDDQSISEELTSAEIVTDRLTTEKSASEPLPVQQLPKEQSLTEQQETGQSALYQVAIEQLTLEQHLTKLAGDHLDIDQLNSVQETTGKATTKQESPEQATAGQLVPEQKGPEQLIPEQTVEGHSNTAEPLTAEQPIPEQPIPEQTAPEQSIGDQPATDQLIAQQHPVSEQTQSSLTLHHEDTAGGNIENRSTDTGENLSTASDKTNPGKKKTAQSDHGAERTGNGNKTPVKSTRGRKSLKQTSAEADLIEIPVDEVLFSKQYYTMGEVAEMFKVNQSLLRFWEAEFDVLKPRKNKKGDRYFRPADIKNLHLIYHLLRQRKYTIEGAKDFLKKNKKAEERFEAIQNLHHIKAFLIEWKAQLEI